MHVLDMLEIKELKFPQGNILLFVMMMIYGFQEK
jgi:hypothetical protein